MTTGEAVAGLRSVAAARYPFNNVFQIAHRLAVSHS
jgi:hypothetical protein